MTFTDTWAAVGKTLKYSWQWHLDNPKLTPIPGTDWSFDEGQDVPALATGFCEWAQMTDGLYMVSILLGNGDKVTTRELGSVSAAVTETHHVTAGVTSIGKATSARFPHREYDHANGTFSPFENYIAIPAPSIETDITMRLATSTVAGGYWVVGNGAPYKFTGTQAEAGVFATAVGPTYSIPAADWPSFIAGATPPAAASINVDITALANALAPQIQAGATVAEIEAVIVAKLNELKFQPVS